MTVIWGIDALVAGAAALMVLVVWQRGRQRSDLGTLSERWMAEMRFRSFDSNR
jgi:hypothetical protein